MIGSLRGTLVDRSALGEVVIEVGGVGYRVTVAPTTAATVGDLGAEVFLYVHHYVREDTETLFGFGGRDERVCFEALLSAHGVGPALALAILSVHPPGDLQQILASDDVSALCLVPGVGQKTATRLLVELKAKLDLPDLDLSRIESAAGADGEAVSRRDVREALVGLGYGPEEVRSALGHVGDGPDAGVLLRDALSHLADR